MAGRSDHGVKVFLSYAHEDRKYQKELLQHLGALKGERIIEVWWDEQILPGSEWDEEIARRLEQADVIVLLVSSAFLDSIYCYEREMRRAVERHQDGTARVIWIYLRPCHWKPAPFAKLQGLPEGMKPVADSSTRRQRDRVWARIAQDIHRVVEAGAARLANEASSQNTATRQSREPPQSAESKPSPLDALYSPPLKNAPTKSFLPPRFCSFNVFGNSIEIGTTDATLADIGSPVQLNERSASSQQIETKTYIRLSFIRDDGEHFPIMVWNMVPPGSVGDRFTVLWVLINETTVFSHSFVNHSTREWSTLQPKRELIRFIGWQGPRNVSRLLLVGIIAVAAVVLAAITFIAPEHAWLWVWLPLSLVAGLAIAVQRVNAERLWRFLHNAQAAIEIS